MTMKDGGGHEISDAKWLAEEVLLPKLNNLEKKIDKTFESQNEMKLNINNLQNENKEGIKERNLLFKYLNKHIRNREKHFNPYYSESTTDKLKRKKVEIGVSIGGGVSITTIIVFADEIIKLLRGG